ncbi:MAG: CCA tRNA nucleotidyltransferase [Myxococcota bacterium]|nr:CCA tRNA nucleotidyltransferase [Myxococcota bacterium]
MTEEPPKKAKLVPTASVLSVLETLTAQGHEAYLVGGGVRDWLLGRPVSDWDVTTSALPADVQSIFSRVVPTGLQHGTVTVVLDVEAIEVTTYRVDGVYADGRRPEAVRFTRNLEDDLARRDFTVNAMAWSPRDDRLVDPFDGRGDLNRRLIRAVGVAMDRLSEDGLRAMRAIRFAAVLGFEIESSLEVAIAQTKDTFSQVSVERMAIEFRKMMMSERAGWGLRMMRKTGLLGIVLAPLAALDDIDFDVMCDRVEHTSGHELLRIAIALSGSATQARAALDHLKFAKRMRDRVQRLVELGSVNNPLSGSRLERCKLAAAVGRDLRQDFITFRVGLTDCPESDEAQQWRTLDALMVEEGIWSGPLSTRELAIGGREVMQTLQIPPSQQIAQVLNLLMEEVWKKPSLNTAQALQSMLPDVARRMQK